MAPRTPYREQHMSAPVLCADCCEHRDVPGTLVDAVHACESRRCTPITAERNINRGFSLRLRLALHPRRDGIAPEGTFLNLGFGVRKIPVRLILAEVRHAHSHEKLTENIDHVYHQALATRKAYSNYCLLLNQSKLWGLASETVRYRDNSPHISR